MTKDFGTKEQLSFFLSCPIRFERSDLQNESCSSKVKLLQMVSFVTISLYIYNIYNIYIYNIYIYVYICISVYILACRGFKSEKMPFPGRFFSGFLVLWPPPYTFDQGYLGLFCSHGVVWHFSNQQKVWCHILKWIWEELV